MQTSMPAQRQLGVKPSLPFVQVRTARPRGASIPARSQTLDRALLPSITHPKGLTEEDMAALRTRLQEVQKDVATESSFTTPRTDMTWTSGTSSPILSSEMSIWRVEQGIAQRVATDGNNRTLPNQDFVVGLSVLPPMPLPSTSNASTGKGAGITTRSCRAALKAENTKQTCVAAPDAEVAVALMQQPEGMNVVCLFDGHGTGGMAPHEAAWAAPQMLQDSTALGKLLAMGRDVHSHLTHAEMQQAGRALQDIYPRMDTHVCGLGDAWADGMFGTSASINVLYGNRLLASNAGDTVTVLSSSGVAERLSSSSAHASSAATASSSSTTTNTTNTTTYHNNDSDSITTSAASSTRSVILSASTTTTSNSASTPPRSGLGCLADKSNGLMSCQPEAVLRVLDPCKHQLMITASGSFWTCVSGQEAVDIVHNMLAITMQQEDEINAEYESSRVHALSSKQAAMHASVADRYTPRSLVATAAARYLADMAMERQKMNGSFNQIGMFDQIGQSQGQGEGDVSVVVSLLQWR